MIDSAGIRYVQCRFPAFSGFPFRLICDSIPGMTPGGSGMAKSRDGQQRDLFRPTLDQIIRMEHPLVKRADQSDWGFSEETLGEV